MSNEETERTMQFILNQQAKFSVDIDLLKESIIEIKNQAELDRQSAKDDRELMKLMFKHLSDNAEADRRMARETAEADRRLVREMVQDLKDTIYRVESKADKALTLVRQNSEEE